VNKAVNKETFVTFQQPFLDKLVDNDPFSKDPLLLAPIPRVLFRSQNLDHSIVLNAKTEWVIGRGKENEIVLVDKLASRRHAVIRAVTPQQFTLVDLESRNGVFANQQRVIKTFKLNNGDRIIVGETELFFRCPSGSVSSGMIDEAKTILMTNGSRVQGQIWREILSSQGISVIWPDDKIDLTVALKHLESINRLPNLLLIDLAATSNSPHEFCSWCSETYPQVKIFLLSTNRTEIYESERRWAQRQGVAELFPAFPAQKLFSNIADVADKVRRVLRAIPCPPLEHSSLVFTLLGLQEQIRNHNLS
jgi:pSer/pThr/pTyr-binding forkhead associated (FHA) protein